MRANPRITSILVTKRSKGVAEHAGWYIIELVARPRIELIAMQRVLRVGNRLSIVALALLLASCASTPPRTATIPPLRHQPVHEIETADFLGMTDSMTRFINNLAPASTSPQKRAWTLSYSVLDPWLLPFDYDANKTLTAAETFGSRTGNCLSFSAMVVAMARSVGLDAWFQEVKVPPEWTNIDETFLVSMHVNAVVKGRNAHFIVDVSGTRRNDWLETTRISDEEALAQYYNNLGADALVKQNLPEAYAYMTKALEIAPQASYVWSNLAVVLNRNGQGEDAKSLYHHALSINPQELTALNNLQQLYVDEGDLAQAEEMQSRVEKYRSKNPWYMYLLSNDAIDEQRFGDAIELLQHAIEINDKEYRFHYALARAWLLAGNNAEAQASLERAQRMAPAESDISRSGLGQILLNVDG